MRTNIVCPDCHRNAKPNTQACVCGYEFPRTQTMIMASRCRDCRGDGIVVATHVETKKRMAYRCQCALGQRYPQWQDGRKWLTYNVIAREKGWLKDGDLQTTPGGQGKNQHVEQQRPKTTDGTGEFGL